MVRATDVVPVRSRVVVLSILLATAGCGRSCTNDPPPAALDAGHRTSDTLTPEQSKMVLAKVGDRTITLGDYAAAIESMDQFDRLRYQSPQRRKELLDEMINVELLSAEAKAKGYDRDPLTEQEIRAILRDAMLTEAHKGAPAPNDVPEADVRAYFDAHKAEFRDPERRRLSAIVLKSEAQAKEVLASAKATTTAAEWGALVRQHSIDAQAKANVPVDLAGDFGIVSPPGDSRGENARVPAEVRAGVFEIGKVGEVLGKVLKSQDKFYVVRLTQKLDPRERAYEEAERTIRVKLSQDRMRAKEDELLAQLRAKYTVQIDDQALSSVKVDWPDAGPAPK